MMISLEIASFIKLTPFKTISFLEKSIYKFVFEFMGINKLDVSWQYILIYWSKKDECPFS